MKKILGKFKLFNSIILNLFKIFYMLKYKKEEKYNSKDLELIKDMGQVPIGRAFKKIQAIINNNGEFIGGCDIAVELHNSGELASLLKK